jgi:putative oxidoreductase
LEKRDQEQMMNLERARWIAVYEGAHAFLNQLQSPFLLGIRLYWGYLFFMAGKGKLFGLERTAGFFEKLEIPFPYLSALLAASAECFGGLLLIVGLGSRLVSIPLAFTMLVAYGTAHRENLVLIFSEPEKFYGASPFSFLIVSLVVLCFGPGKISIDYFLERKKSD